MQTTKGTYDHLTLNEYTTFADQFKSIFSVDDLSLFTSFHNMDYFNKVSNPNSITMLWYIWQVHIKPLFQNQLGRRSILLEQLTAFNLNENLPTSRRINL